MKFILIINADRKVTETSAAWDANTEIELYELILAEWCSYNECNSLEDFAKQNNISMNEVKMQLIHELSLSIDGTIISMITFINKHF